MVQKVIRPLVNEFRGGLGLRPPHYPYLANNFPQLASWFEVISENFMDSQGQPLEKLLLFRRNFPIALHGVSLGIGGPDPVDEDYLRRLKNLVDRVDPIVVSDHFCWTSLGGHYSHDLLPLPYTRSTLNRIVEKVDQVQNFLGRQILLENPSAYLSYPQNELSESEFIRETCQRSGCLLLLDLNNVYVSCTNFKWKTSDYLRDIPSEIVGQIHLAGFKDKDQFLFDTHSTPVADDVWEIYSQNIHRMRGVLTMVEWDDEIPDFPTYENELKKAFHKWQESKSHRVIHASQ